MASKSISSITFLLAIFGWKYANDQGVDVSHIEAVDYIWDGRPLHEVIDKYNYYDYIVASHVIEHTPNLLGFLMECEILLEQNGALVLAIPDKRRCFDLFRPLSTTGAVLQAHVEERTRHTPGTAFDHVAYFATMLGHDGCVAGTDGEPRLEHALAFAQTIFHRSVASQAYFDFHAWTFTPSSFRMILKDLYELDQLKLREGELRTSSHEFFVRLSRSAKGCDLTSERIAESNSKGTQRFALRAATLDCDVGYQTKSVGSRGMPVDRGG